MLPTGFVCLGDAVCALCPVYGQGMTVSALSAIILRDWLNDPRSRLADGSYISSRFQKSLAKSNSLHWSLATTQDSRFPTTEGGKLPERSSNLLTWYTKRLLMKTNSDASLHTILMEVVHLLKSPLALYHPLVIFRVLRGHRATN